MRLPELIFAEILVKPGLNGLKAATPLAPISESPISANFVFTPRGGGGAGYSEFQVAGMIIKGFFGV